MKGENADPGSLGLVNIIKLKQWAVSSLGKDSALRNVLLGEPEYLKADEFLVKLTVWMKLGRIEDVSRSH